MRLEIDTEIFLCPSAGLNCSCRAGATVDVVYDSVFRSPICSVNNCSSALNCSRPADGDINQKCATLLVRERLAASPSMKSIQIYRDASTNCTSCPANFVRFRDYCIPLALLSEYFNYKQFKVTQSNAVNIYADLEFLMFFCQSMHIGVYCEAVANLCVLSQYSLERFSPCNLFYASQSNVVSGIDSRVTPFLFYAKGKSTIDDLDKIIDQRYRYGSYREDFFEDAELRNEVSLVLVGHSVDGDLKTIEPLRIGDFSFCRDKKLPDAIRFGEDLVSSCRLDLRELVARGEQRPWMLNLYLNYTENKVNLMKAVPVLIRNAFSHNMVR